jgi:MoxR-like ATPase
MSALLRAARVIAWLDGRDYLTPEDLRAVLPCTVAHRVFFTPVYELRRAELADALMTQMLERIATPATML